MPNTHILHQPDDPPGIQILGLLAQVLLHRTLTLNIQEFQSIEMDFSYSLWELIPRRMSGLVQDVSAIAPSSIRNIWLISSSRALS
jgi:hypothetical protein